MKNMRNTLLSSGLPKLTSFGVRVGLSISLFAFAFATQAQNLVPNWSFEDTAYCFTANNPILVAPPWFSANTATPDTYNMDDSPCGVYMDPTETIGLICYQAAFHGNRFAGEYIWENGTELKDYMEVELVQPLQAGHSYRVAMEVSLPDCRQFAVNTLGAYFASDTVFDPTVPIPGALPVVPQAQFHDANFYTDEVNWMHVEDTIVASGGERFMVIGSYTDQATTETLPVSGNFGFSHAYYYFDAIVVEEVSSGESVPEGLLLQGTTDALGISWAGMDRIEHVSLFDLRGRCVFEDPSSANGSTVVIAVGHLAAGTYVVRAQGRGRRAIAKWTRMD